jgi:hypothetical protein
VEIYPRRLSKSRRPELLTSIHATCPPLVRNSLYQWLLLPPINCGYMYDTRFKISVSNYRSVCISRHSPLIRNRQIRRSCFFAVDLSLSLLACSLFFMIQPDRPSTWLSGCPQVYSTSGWTHGFLCSTCCYISF